MIHCNGMVEIAFVCFIAFVIKTFQGLKFLLIPCKRVEPWALWSVARHVPKACMKTALSIRLIRFSGNLMLFCSYLIKTVFHLLQYRVLTAITKR